MLPRKGKPAVHVAAALCYEDLWPHILSAQLSQRRIDFLLSLSNDAWFQNSAASLQHHRLAAWRTIELRRALLRVTNNGVTGLVDPLGRTVKQLPRFTAGVLAYDSVPLLDKVTFFSRYGRFVPWVFSILVCLIPLMRLFWRTLCHIIVNA